MRSLLIQMCFLSLLSTTRIIVVSCYHCCPLPLPESCWCLPIITVVQNAGILLVSYYHCCPHCQNPVGVFLSLLSTLPEFCGYLQTNVFYSQNPAGVFRPMHYNARIPWVSYHCCPYCQNPEGPHYQNLVGVFLSLLSTARIIMVSSDHCRPHCQNPDGVFLSLMFTARILLMSLYYCSSLQVLEAVFMVSV